MTDWHDFFTDSADDEQVQAMSFVERLVDKFTKDNNKAPVRLFASDADELQSFIMWSGQTLGLKVERTHKNKSYVE